ncbi:MAG: DUF3365 domain-containing protein, partial [Gammaproteobacteria bacterium]|nr:DUF3365 domain-containing protein [Gammaproteobacteria bacterium]
MHGQIGKYVNLIPDRTILTLLVAFGLAAAALLWHQSRTQASLVESMALQDAALYSDTLREFRTLYTSEVVEAVLTHGIEVSHDYKSKAGAIPLPATFSMLLGNRIAEHGGGGEMRLYSPYPFPWRQETGGLTDDFNRYAWDSLNENPDESVFRFTEVDGRAVLRYATADVMRKDCVGCHNADDLEGGLSLETFADLQQGGANGPALLPGQSTSSRFIRVLTGESKLR